MFFYTEFEHFLKKYQGQVFWTISYFCPPRNLHLEKSSYFQIVNVYLGTTLLITEIEKKLLPLVRTLVFKNDFPVGPIHSMLLDFTGSSLEVTTIPSCLHVHPCNLVWRNMVFGVLFWGSENICHQFCKSTVLKKQYTMYPLFLAVFEILVYIQIAIYTTISTDSPELTNYHALEYRQTQVGSFTSPNSKPFFFSGKIQSFLAKYFILEGKEVNYLI